MKRFVFALVLIGLPSLAGSAFGCVCVMLPNQTPEQVRAERLDAYNRAAAVFAGRVIETSQGEAVLQVERSWKGDATREIRMALHSKTAQGEYMISTCDYHFQRDERYLVYAYATPEGLRTGRCSRTMPLRIAEEEMRGLGEIIEPVIYETNAASSFEPVQPQTTDDGSNLVGDWTGESICVGNNPNCHDEKVIYHFTRSQTDARKFKLIADKVIDGKPEFMYEQDFVYDPEKKMLVGEFQNARYHGLWEYRVKGDEMEGTLSLLPERTLGRRIKVKKVK